jgi:hypothetical protein
MSRWQPWETDYPAVRRVMGPDRDRYDDAALEHLIERQFPGTEPQHVEDFMRGLQQFGRQAAPILQKVGPGMAQGAMQGAMIGGPWGALAGALGGGAMSMLGGGGGPAPGRPPGPPAGAAGPVAGLVGGLAPMAAAALGGGGGGASGQLLTLLSRPETIQALLALTMGQAGRSNVPVGRRQVPAAAFANAVSELAAEAALGGEDSSSYWLDRQGMPRCDLANPAARAGLLWNDLAEASEAEAAEAAESEEAADWEEWEDESEEWESDEVGDALDRFEAALEGTGDDS